MIGCLHLALPGVCGSLPGNSWIGGSIWTSLKINLGTMNDWILLQQFSSTVTKIHIWLYSRKGPLQ